MINEQRTVRFANSVEVISKDDENNIDRSFVASDLDSDSDGDSSASSASVSRSAWNPSEIAFFSEHQLNTLQKLDLAPRQPQRSLDSILNDAINTCEALLTMSPCDEGRIASNSSPPQIHSRHGRLDRSLFSIRADSSFPPPPPLDTSCIISQALAEIAR